MKLNVVYVWLHYQIKRPQAKAYFEQAITRMYAEVAASEPPPKKAAL